MIKIEEYDENRKFNIVFYNPLNDWFKIILPTSNLELLDERTYRWNVDSLSGIITFPKSSYHSKRKLSSIGLDKLDSFVAKSQSQTQLSIIIPITEEKEFSFEYGIMLDTKRKINPEIRAFQFKI